MSEIIDLGNLFNDVPVVDCESSDDFVACFNGLLSKMPEESAVEDEPIDLGEIFLNVESGNNDEDLVLNLGKLIEDFNNGNDSFEIDLSELEIPQNGENDDDFVSMLNEELSLTFNSLVRKSKESGDIDLEISIPDDDGVNKGNDSIVISLAEINTAGSLSNHTFVKTLK